MTSHNYMFKFVVVGDSGVGKSNLLLQFKEKRFQSAYHSTVGVEFGQRTMTLGDDNIRIQVWDTAGQEIFRSITRSYYRGADAALLAYDVANRSSFVNVLSWLQDMRRQCSSNLVVTLIGNKSDLDDLREVTREEGEAFARQNGLRFFETSAKSSDNVEEAFLLSAKLIYQKILQGIVDKEDGFDRIKLNAIANDSNGLTKRRKCCV